MIKSVSATPEYTNVGDWEAKKLTGFGIFIDCDVNDAYEIFNLIKEMTERRDAAKPQENKDNNYWIDTNANGGTDWVLYRRGGCRNPPGEVAGRCPIWACIFTAPRKGCGNLGWGRHPY